ncbi:hypothetical protein Ahy_A01g000594 isoform B [Arachis hypogaea]|uniref:Uncharacterized protein n=1 Tax=Arachis hypogaea TaxID=3818 RepID=A0A445EKU1_ARAHY|nr:hypothetical protein Ahy_A01g000594 isoform B [Arachis hypogaea]
MLAATTLQPKNRKLTHTKLHELQQGNNIERMQMFRHLVFATAGIPIPGKVESPQQKSCGMGVEEPGKLSLPASSAGPNVPLCLLRYLLCVSGLPTNFTSHFSLLKPSPSTRSTAFQITSDLSALSFLYSGLVRSSPSHNSNGSVPGGAISGLSTLGTDTSTTFCSASTPLSQSFTTT